MKEKEATAKKRRKNFLPAPSVGSESLVFTSELIVFPSIICPIMAHYSDLLLDD